MCTSFSLRKSAAEVINWVLHSRAMMLFVDPLVSRDKNCQWREKCGVVNTSQCPIDFLVLWRWCNLPIKVGPRCWIWSVRASRARSQGYHSLETVTWCFVSWGWGEQSGDKIHKYSFQPTLGNWDVREGWDGIEAAVLNCDVISSPRHIYTIIMR